MPLGLAIALIVPGWIAAGGAFYEVRRERNERLAADDAQVEARRLVNIESKADNCRLRNADAEASKDLWEWVLSQTTPDPGEERLVAEFSRQLRITYARVRCIKLATGGGIERVPYPGDPEIARPSAPPPPTVVPRVIRETRILQGPTIVRVVRTPAPPPAPPPDLGPLLERVAELERRIASVPPDRTTELLTQIAELRAAVNALPGPPDPSVLIRLSALEFRVTRIEAAMLAPPPPAPPPVVAEPPAPAPPPAPPEPQPVPVEILPAGTESPTTTP